jgi:hypothetical protein
LCSNCGKKTEERKARRCTTRKVTEFWHSHKWQCWAPVICHLALADNGFASPPLYGSFKIPLKCGVYIRISKEYSKYFIVFNNKY